MSSPTRVVATFSRSSAVISSVKCKLCADDDVEYLVVAKLSRLEAYSLREHGLQFECAVDIWGKVLKITSVPVTDQHSNILLLLDHPRPELVSISLAKSVDGRSSLVREESISLHERLLRPAEFTNNVIVSMGGTRAVVHCYTGRLKVITLTNGVLDPVSASDIILRWNNVISICFLPTDEFNMAVLYLEETLLKLISLDEEGLQSPELTQTALSQASFYIQPDLAPSLVSVDSFQGSPGGVLIFGGKKIFFYEIASSEEREKQNRKRRRIEKKKADPRTSTAGKEDEEKMEKKKRAAKAQIAWPWSDVRATCAIDAQRYLIGDDYGRLALLALSDVHVGEMTLFALGETSSPTTLNYLSNSVIFVGSHVGDSQVVKIHPTPVSDTVIPIPDDIQTVSADMTDSLNVGRDEIDKPVIFATKGSYLSVLEKFQNAAPVSDAVLINTGKGEENEIITCAGGRNTGSLNVIRAGVAFEEKATIPEFGNSIGIWPLKEHSDEVFHQHILISTTTSTHLLHIISKSQFSLAEPVTKGFETESRTLLAANMSNRTPTGEYMTSSLVVQVTPKTVLLLKFDRALGEYERIAEYKPSQDIVAASANPSQIFLGLNAGHIALLFVENERFQTKIADSTRISTLKPFEAAHDIIYRNEISAVCCVPVNPALKFSSIYAVGLWQTNHVEVYKLERTGELKLISKSEPLGSPINSLLFFDFNTKTDSRPALLVGLGDGSLVYFNWKEKQLKDGKIVSLGDLPVSLTPCKNTKGRPIVFAAGSRATILALDNNRISHSAIMLKDTHASASLHSSNFPSSLILSSAVSISIGGVGDLAKMYIRTVPLGLDTPRCIAYDHSTNLLGVGLSRTEPPRFGSPEISTSSSFSVWDAKTLSCLNRFYLRSAEEASATALIESTVGGIMSTFFCVGTYFYHPEELEASEGRLLLLDARKDDLTAHISLRAEVKEKGAVHSICGINGYIAVAINSCLTIYGISLEGEYGVGLQKLTEWNHNYTINQMSVHGTTLVISDQLASVAFLTVNDDGSLKTIARDYGPISPLSIDAISENGVIGANDSLNMFSFTVETRNDLRKSLHMDGYYNIGEIVTKFLKGSIMPGDGTIFMPQSMFFTATGEIGVIIDVVDPNVAKALVTLQQNMNLTLPKIGQPSHAKYRAPQNIRGPTDADEASFGFIDGDFLEEFLPSSTELATSILKGESIAQKVNLSEDIVRDILQSLQDLH